MPRMMVISLFFIVFTYFSVVPYLSYSIEKEKQEYEVVQTIQTYYSLYSAGKIEEANQFNQSGMSIFKDDNRSLHLYQPKDEMDTKEDIQDDTLLLIPADFDVRLVGNSAIATFKLYTSYKKISDPNTVYRYAVVTAVLEQKQGNWVYIHVHKTKV